MLNKNLYFLFLLTILLCVSIDISYYNYIALGKEDDSNDVDNVGEKEKEADDNRDNDIREYKEQEKDFEDLSLDELAQSVNLSVWRLAHIFAADVGKSPMQYLRELRLERAKHLLETSFLSIKEITHQVGMKDCSHFVRDFKKAYGAAPTHYRLRAGVTNESDSENAPEPNSPADKADQENMSRRTNNKQLAKTAKRSILLFINVLSYWASTLELAT